MSGFRELVQTIKAIAADFPEQQHFVSFVSFNSHRMNIGLDGVPVSDIYKLDNIQYSPIGNTPLYDAIAFSANHLRERIGDPQHANVLVMILTDGMENTSKRYNLQQTKDLISLLEYQNWTFTYIGTDHDIDFAADSIGIRNKKKFDKNRRGIRRMLNEEKAARHHYSQSIREGKNMRGGYYTKENRDD